MVGIFGECGVVDVRVVRGRDTDRPRGYFVQFDDVPSLERALAFDGYNLGGRQLRVNVAEVRRRCGASSTLDFESKPGFKV